MYTDVDVAGELHSWTAAVARPTCGEGVDVLRTRGLNYESGLR